MKAADRRKAIVNLLLSSNEAISGGKLSEEFGVSRQIIVQDIAMLHLHVVLAIDRAGLVGDDGPTHHGVFDVGFFVHVHNGHLQKIWFKDYHAQKRKKYS